jgi:DNA repair photolyase
LVAPVLPGISDAEGQLRSVARACAEAGAVSATPLMLHLRPGVREHYLGWLASERPELVADHEARYQRAYLPRAEGERVRAIVSEAFRGAARLSA